MLETARPPRSYAEIREAALRAIPRLLPEWTDFNASDPGVTLLELFAAMAESLHWRLSDVPDALYRQLLEVVGLRPCAAIPAAVELTFEPDQVPRVGNVPAGTRVAAANPAGGDPIVFTTERDLGLTATPLVAVQVFDGATFVDATDLQAEVGKSYFPFGRRGQAGAALYLGFAPNAAAERPIFPSEIGFHLFLPAAVAAGQPVAQGAGLEPPPLVPLARLVFEYRAAGALDRWRQLATFADGTGGFAGEGPLRIAGPSDSVATPEGKRVDQPCHWLRCRVVDGFPAGRAPEIEALLPNTVTARALERTEDEILGVGDGLPGQSFRLRGAPLVPGSLELVDETGEAWQEVEHLGLAGPDQPAFMVDWATAVVSLGDGIHGRILGAALELVAVRYDHGGGAGGNVGQGTVTAILSPLQGVKAASNRRAGRGGRDGESAAELVARAPTHLRVRDQAVTAADYEALAEAAGQVRRAKALPLVHPDYPGVEVPGCVTIVILPEGDDRQPQPSAALLREVLRYLAAYRTLATELHVKGPSFTEIAVSARLEIAPEHSPAIVEEQARQALDRFLAAKDWPFGRDLEATRLYGVLLAVDGVRGVPWLALKVGDQPYDRLDRPVVLPPDGLVSPGTHDLTSSFAADL